MSDCLLCGKADSKLAKAHIIPRCLYGPTINCEAGPAKIITDKAGEYPKKSPIGVYDAEIVCIDCEAMFSPWDDYACELFMQTEPAPTFVAGDKPVAGVYQDVDLSKLKMFFIALIWRMHVTTQPMFLGVKLGPYEEKCRDAILRNDPGIVPELDVVVAKFHDPIANGFLGPTSICLEGINGYRVGFALHMCWVKIDKRLFPHPFNLMAISRGNPVHVLFREFAGSPEQRAMVEVAKAQSDG